MTTAPEATSTEHRTEPGGTSATEIPTPVSVERRLATELGVRQAQVDATVALLDDGSTVPFIARYRKEITGGLDDAQLRTLEERLHYLRELDARRATVIESIREQGKLTETLHRQLLAADTKARVEDIYLPYKPKRRTKAQIAREAGHEPVADALLTDPTTDPGQYTTEQLDGARAILVERFAEDADLLAELREMMWQRGRITATVREGKAETGSKFADYFAFDEAFSTVPSHRVLALLRGEKEDVLQLRLEPDAPDAASEPSSYETQIAARFHIADQGRAADRWLAETVRWAWRTKLAVSVGIDTRMRLRQAAEHDAVAVFATNLRDLLLAAPAGTRPTMGLDPGYRTGVKVAVVDGTGKVVATEVIYPHKPQGQWDKSLTALQALATQHQVELIAIGNGTASRETDALASALISRMSQDAAQGQQTPTKIVVSEAGASVYSASAFASQELGELDVSLRGAVSIARRLQDPLAELVKIDPKSIGVGQYQHDVSETRLARSLGAVVEDAVNAVGVEVNTASSPLLSRVSGITESVAENIVAHRNQHGPFKNRIALREVPRLGPKAFEQCAGFLRIQGGNDPIDASAVHPEAYPVVRAMVSATGKSVADLIGNAPTLRELRPEDFTDDQFGVPTVSDILTELEKPGRDPRPEFTTAQFAAGIEKVADLTAGLVLEGVVTNVAAFGAFIDIGVHQDGLVHVSAMSREFVKDPRDIVKSGDVVKVKVMEVDVPRQRIGLSLRLDDEPGATKPERNRQPAATPAKPKTGGSARGGKNTARKPSGGRERGGPRRPAPQGSMADALRRAGFGQ